MVVRGYVSLLMRLLAFALVLFAIGPSARADETAYYVGNSLTHQGTGASGGGVASLAGQMGYAHSAWGAHIRCSSGMQAIWNDPSTTCVDPNQSFGTFDNALPNFDWTRVSLQPWYSDPVETSLARFVDFYDLTQSQGRNSGTIFYVFQGHPDLSGGGDYADVWMADYNPADGLTIVTRDAMAQVIEGVRLHPGIDANRVFMVPTGDVWLEIDTRMRAGLIPGFNTVQDDIYADDLVHLERVGRWVEGMTFAATFYGQSPEGLTIPGAYPPFTVTAEQKSAFEDAVWDVVSTHQYTGVPEPALAAPLTVCALLLLRRPRYLGRHHLRDDAGRQLAQRERVPVGPDRV